MNQFEHKLWVEKYRPQTLDECVLPDRIKQMASDIIKSGTMGHMILSGSAGTGKTTLAKVLAKELDTDIMFINGSLDGNMATLREQIVGFASSLSMEERRKCVLLDEGDHITHNVMAALRSLMEEMSQNCSFIFTCNFPNKILDAIHSRCTQIDFTMSKQERLQMATAAFKRVKYILDAEGVQYDGKVVAQLLNKCYPDMRKIITDLQSYSKSGVVDSGIFANSQVGDMQELIKIMSNKEFSKMRKWVAGMQNPDMTALCRELYDEIDNFVQKPNQPQVILHLADYQYKSAFVGDIEICIVAMLSQIMLEC